MISAALLEQIPDGLFLVDDTGRIRFANRRAEAIFGYPRGSMVGAQVDALLPDEVRDRHRDHREAFLMAPQQRPMEQLRDVRALRRDGSPVLLQISLGRVGKGDDAATIALVRDVSSRPTADERAHIFEVAVAAAANGIAITDAAGNFVYVNEAFTRLTGYRAEEVIGQSTRILKSGRHDPSFYRHLWMSITKGEVWHGETVNRRKDGSLYVEEQTIAPVRGDSGAITHYVAIKHDITARRSAEEALRRRIRELSVLHRLAVLSIEAIDVQTFATRIAMTLREHLDLLAVELEVSDPSATVSPTDRTLPSFRAGPAAPTSGDTLVFPLWVAGRKLGELRVRVRPFDLERSELERFLETFATQAASALARAQLQEEVRRDRR